MAASYPATIKSFTAPLDGVDYVKAADITTAQEEIVALETTWQMKTGTPASPSSDMFWVDPATKIAWVYDTYAASARWVSFQLFKSLSFQASGGRPAAVSDFIS